MTDRSVVCSDHTVRALLNGQKTILRQILKPGPSRLLCRTCGATERAFKAGECSCSPSRLEWTRCQKPLVDKTNHLYVREILTKFQTFGAAAATCHYPADHTAVVAPPGIDSDTSGRALWRWPRNSILSPRWASRITLIVENVKIERLHDISDADCWSEGIEAFDGVFDLQIPVMAKRVGAGIDDAKSFFACVWESTHGRNSWDKNPWVSAISFTAVKENIDDIVDITE